ncbi:unnamed protein product, partial [Adineta ricciae]
SSTGGFRSGSGSSSTGGFRSGSGSSRSGGLRCGSGSSSTGEGSNQSAANLTLGSSWTLIYNGASGLATYPGPNSGGSIQQTNNTISYKSYRFLVSGKRSTSNSVLYSELIFYGY